MAGIDEILEILDNAADNADSFELSSYEQDEAYEIESYLTRAQNVPAYRAKRIARAAVKNRPALAKIQSEMRMNAGRGKIELGNMADTPDSVAQFNFTVTRNTANINSKLPVMLFAAQEAQNGFRASQLTGLIPAGVVLTSVRFGENASQPNAMRFTYTEGANVDTIDVTCNEYPYPSVIQSMSVDLLQLSKVRISLSDATAVSQLNNTYKMVSNTMFGKQASNAFAVGAYKSPEQFQSGIVDVDGVFKVDKETGLLFNINNTAGFSVTFSMFVQKLYSQRAQGKW